MCLKHHVLLMTWQWRQHCFGMQIKFPHWFIKTVHMHWLNQLYLLCVSSNVTFVWRMFTAKLSHWFWCCCPEWCNDKHGGRGWQTNADSETRSHLLFLYTRWKSSGCAGLDWSVLSGEGLSLQIWHLFYNNRNQIQTLNQKEKYNFRGFGRKKLLFI